MHTRRLSVFIRVYYAAVCYAYFYAKTMSLFFSLSVIVLPSRNSVLSFFFFETGISFSICLTVFSPPDI
jgi:hypothetical protein